LTKACPGRLMKVYAARSCGGTIRVGAREAKGDGL
jgi:hypothetical protein